MLTSEDIPVSENYSLDRIIETIQSTDSYEIERQTEILNERIDALYSQLKESAKNLAQLKRIKASRGDLIKSEILISNIRSELNKLSDERNQLSRILIYHSSEFSILLDNYIIHIPIPPWTYMRM